MGRQASEQATIPPPAGETLEKGDHAASLSLGMPNVLVAHRWIVFQ